MTKTQRVPLKNVRLSPKVVLSSATLLLHQDHISDGLGGQLPGMRSWEISVPSGLPLDLFMSGDQLTFEAGEYSGRCFAKNNTTLQGTGPVKGLA
ncbi:hypothetical protein [Granulicella arctica]|uniref:hypothetical protein n=1 Tax=Granulicella arctica TaxID=940613 RepID=UPI0021DFDDC9|nr:hypothetical protein [Granulicella arctica]